jgi:hypothetical protein
MTQTGPPTYESSHPPPRYRLDTAFGSNYLALFHQHILVAGQSLDSLIALTLHYTCGSRPNTNRR